MFFLSLYWLLSPVLWILLPVFSIFNPKLRHHFFHESTSWKEAEKKIGDRGEGNPSTSLRTRKQVVHFHAASTGEFEQLQPILKKVDRSRYFILLTFFSPTVFTIEKNTDLADAVCYHPFDFLWSAWKFFRMLDIKHYIITRNDIWPTHLFIAQKLGINTVLINANLYKKYHYTSWIFQTFFHHVLGKFNLILTGSEQIRNNLLKLVPAEKIRVTGDSRLDRVLERKAENSDSLLPESFRESRTIILGSIIPGDYPSIFGGLENYYSNGQKSLEEKDQRIIIVPHEVAKSDLVLIEKKLNEIGFDWAYYSEKKKLQNSRIVIIDKTGILADLYAFADISYVGGGFGAGVHSVIEPAVYKNAVSFGPNHQIVDMAVSLTEHKLATVIQSTNDFVQFLSLLDNQPELEKVHGNMESFLTGQKQAANAIIEEIFSHD